MSEGPSEQEPGGRPRNGLLSLAPVWVWAVLAALAGGSLSLGSFTFIYASGFSYISNDPAACVNCHVMREVYDGWNHGSHRNVAVCNDCHTPHDPIGKYAIKALNGYNHSMAFTLGGFPEPIRITALNRDVAQRNCLYCHTQVVRDINHGGAGEPIDCLRCHAGVGHGR
jgi:cytochrome c nitrite reductase small subunit